MKALCQLCGEIIASVNIGGELDGRPPLSYPPTGSMFGSSDPEHHVPAPFDPSVIWSDDMKDLTPGHLCPYGRIHRAFVEFDLIKTDKGMVRLPRDGSPAFIDSGETGNLDRARIPDAVATVSDEEAERQVRARLSKGDYEVEHDPDVSGFICDHKPLPPPPELYPCPICKKSFLTEKAMKGHMGGAHKPAKVVAKFKAKKK